MPVYEYECPACEKIIEVQQRMADDPLSQCPDCEGPVKKIMSMSSFKLKGGGWYADGYASVKPDAKKDTTSSKSDSTPKKPVSKKSSSKSASATASS